MHKPICLLSTLIISKGLLFLLATSLLAADCSTDANKCSKFELCDKAIDNSSGKPSWTARAENQKYVEAAKKSPYTNCGVTDPRDLSFTVEVGQSGAKKRSHSHAPVTLCRLPTSRIAPRNASTTSPAKESTESTLDLATSFN